MVFNLAEDVEVVNLHAIAGEYDMQERNIMLAKLPVLLRNQQKSGYKVYLDTGFVRLRHDDPLQRQLRDRPEIAKWLRNVDFRRALSLGVDRDQLNEAFWLGMGTPGSIVPDDDNIYNPGPEYRKLWSVYDPKQANALLDKIGLGKRDADGYRLRSDGKGRLRLIWNTLVGQIIPHTQIAQWCASNGRRLVLTLMSSKSSETWLKKRPPATR